MDPAPFPDAAPSDPMFNELSQLDQLEYQRLSQFFALEERKNQRAFSLPAFIHHLSVIHRFVAQGNRDDVLRGIVCGIEFTQYALLVNIGKLKKLMRRSKSCMNGSFQKLGYHVVRPPSDLSSVLTQIFPKYTSASGLVGRQWCIRKLTHEAPVCFLPNLNVNLLELAPTGHGQKEVARPLVPELQDSTVGPNSDDFMDDVDQLLNRKEVHRPIRCISGPFFQRIS
jgi:hypothetical protein